MKEEVVNIDKIYDLVIVGGGIVGAALAYYLSRYQLDILLVDASAYLGAKTSLGNSGIIHGGFDAKPEESKARLNVEGRKIWNQWFNYLTFPRLASPSLVLAFDKEEESSCFNLLERGYINGLSKDELFYLDSTQLRDFQAKRQTDFGIDFDSILGALVCTSSYVVDPHLATLALVGAAKNNGLSLLRSTPVEGLVSFKEQGGGIALLTKQGLIKARKVINAAGAGASKIAASIGDNSIKVRPRRGQYLVIEGGGEHAAKAPVIFGVPSKYGKGVLVSPRADLNYIIGPTADEDLEFKDASLIDPDLFDRLRALGKKLAPGIDSSRVIGAFAGTRTISEGGDFIIALSPADPNLINVAAIQSPGLSAAPAIAIDVAHKLLDLPLKEKEQFNPYFEVIF